MDIGLLDDRGQRPLGHPARFQKAGKVAALAQFRDAQFDSPGAGLPVALAIAVALDEARGGLLAMARAGQAPTSISINRSAAKEIMSRKISASGPSPPANAGASWDRSSWFLQVRASQPKPIRKSR
jgi:hypothetical protein